MRTLASISCAALVLLVALSFVPSVFASTGNVQNTYGIQFIPAPPVKLGTNITVNAWTANMKITSVTFTIVVPGGGKSSITNTTSSCSIALSGVGHPNGLCSETVIYNVVAGDYQVQSYFYVGTLLRGVVIQNFDVNDPGPNLQNSYGMQFTPVPPETVGSNVTILAWTANLVVNQTVIKVIAPGGHSTTVTLTPTSCTIPLDNHPNGMCATTKVLNVVAGDYRVFSNFNIDNTTGGKTILRGTVIQNLLVK
jgi:hypothetical protein